MEHNVAMCARLSFSLPLLLAFAGTAAAETVPTKEIVIYNNSDQDVRVYPVIQAGRNVGNADLWMQAQFAIATDQTYARQFPMTKNYY